MSQKEKVKNEKKTWYAYRLEFYEIILFAERGDQCVRQYNPDSERKMSHIITYLESLDIYIDI